MACGGLWAASGLGGLGGPPGASGGLLGGEFQVAFDLCFRCSPRGCRGFWAGFWHRFIVLSRRVDFRSQVLSSGFSLLFRLHLETQAFELKQVVILNVVFRFGKKQPLKKKRNKRFLLSFLSNLEAVFVHFDVNFWLRRGFAFDALLGALVFLGSLVGEKTALISCIVSLRLFSSANALHGVLVTFRGPFWD